jgi:hypothetical protein
MEGTMPASCWPSPEAFCGWVSEWQLLNKYAGMKCFVAVPVRLRLHGQSALYFHEATLQVYHLISLVSRG